VCSLKRGPEKSLLWTGLCSYNRGQPEKYREKEETISGAWPVDIRRQARNPSGGDMGSVTRGQGGVGEHTSKPSSAPECTKRSALQIGNPHRQRGHP